MRLSESAHEILTVLENAGLTPYVVGGAVRDSLLGKDTLFKDVDIEVFGGTVEQVYNLLSSIGQVDEVGKSFGILKIFLKGEEFDVSLPRKEIKNGEGHRGFTVEVDPNLSLSVATSRRDFTVNALMYSRKQEAIIDLHGGVEDLNNRVLKHVSDAFSEDPLRVLRGMQMVARFDMKLAEETIVKSASLKEQYDTLAVERVQIEFQKLFNSGKNIVNGLTVLALTGWDACFPGLREVNNSVLWEQIDAVSVFLKQYRDVDRELIFTAVIASFLNDTERVAFLDTCVVSIKKRRQVLDLLAIVSPVSMSAMDVYFFSYGMPDGLNILSWYVYQSVKDTSGFSFSVFEKASLLGVELKPIKDVVSGKHVIELFPDRVPGRWVKDILDDVRFQQYSGKVLNPIEGVNWIKEKHNLL